MRTHRVCFNIRFVNGRDGMNGCAQMYGPESIVAHFKAWSLDDETRFYLRFHAKRYAFLIDMIRRCAASISQQAGMPCNRMLDVGPSALTQFIRDKDFAETIDSLGYEDGRFSCRAHDRHTEYDLTKTVDPASWPRMSAYDIIIMAEVIEHLPVPPNHVLAFLAGLLKPHGVLIVQTPNACSLPKRLRMLHGQNPYEMIRDCPRNPGHFREYTVREMADLAQASGLLVHSVSVANYFLRNTWTSRLFRRIEWLVPGALRDGITMMLGSDHGIVQPHKGLHS